MKSMGRRISTNKDHFCKDPFYCFMFASVQKSTLATLRMALWLACGYESLICCTNITRIRVEVGLYEALVYTTGIPLQFSITDLLCDYAKCPMLSLYSGIHGFTSTIVVLHVISSRLHGREYFRRCSNEALNPGFYLVIRLTLSHISMWGKCHPCNSNVGTYLTNPSTTSYESHALLSLALI